MNLSELFIRRPVMTVALTVSVLLFGVWAYFQLPVSDLPSIDYPVIQVQVDYPGATPETMANNVATPLERQFMQIPGLQLVTSNNGQGHSSFILQFDLSKSVDGAATDVQAAITRAQGQLPVDLPSPPTFTKTNPNDQPIMYIALASDTVTEGQLYDFANTQVGERITILPGVSQVAIYGAQSAVRIKADPSLMAARNISLEDLTTAVKNGTAYTGAGQLDGTHRTFLLQPQGQLATADSYNNLIVGQNNGAPIYLKDVATAKQGVRDERINIHFWSREIQTPGATVVVAVFRRAGTNAVDVSRSVRNALPGIKAELPGSVSLAPIYDRSLTIVDGIHDVQTTLIIAFGLVVMVIFIFLGRATDTLIPAIALPLSLLLTFVAMHVLGYSLDNLSLMALTLAIGFLVDDAIVFLENTVRLMEGGMNAFDASIESAKEISFTILAMTLSLAAVFIPLVFMSGLMGRIFREFSITIVISILASGLVSLTLTPLMTSRMLGNRGEGTKKTWMERAFGAVEHRVLDAYGRSLWFFLRNRWISALTWVICLAGTAYFFSVVPKSFLPVGDSSFIRGVLVAQEGSSPEQMHAYQAKAEEIIKANPAVRHMVNVSGAGSFFPANQAAFFVFLKDPKQRASIEQVSGQLMGAIGSSIPGTVA
ncbi:MAG TPA: efflux RND transporter permease subunit, partial [Terriglobales bacterium]